MLPCFDLVQPQRSLRVIGDRKANPRETEAQRIHKGETMRHDLSLVSKIRSLVRWTLPAAVACVMMASTASAADAPDEDCPTTDVVAEQAATAISSPAPPPAVKQPEQSWLAVSALAEPKPAEPKPARRAPSSSYEDEWHGFF